MTLAPNKTKLVCTIGPASESPDILRHMLEAGMNIARLNFSHGDFDWHKKVIENLRLAARTTGKRVTIMADLPGPKIRIGQLAQEPIELKPGDAFILTTEEITGDRQRAFVSFPRLPAVVRPGDCLFLNDGIIQLEVLKVAGKDVECRVLVGGELRSRKGLNLPGIDLVIVPTTTGYTARMVSRFKLPVWIVAVSPEEETCHGLQFSYRVAPIHAPEYPDDWSAFATRWVQSEGLADGLVVLTEGPSRRVPHTNPRLEIIDLRRD